MVSKTLIHKKVYNIISPKDIPNLSDEKIANIISNNPKAISSYSKYELDQFPLENLKYKILKAKLQGSLSLIFCFNFSVSSKLYRYGIVRGLRRIISSCIMNQHTNNKLKKPI